MDEENRNVRCDSSKDRVKLDSNYERIARDHSDRCRMEATKILKLAMRMIMKLRTVCSMHPRM